MRNIMFGYKIKLMRKLCAKKMCKVMFGYKIKVMHNGCESYEQENA